MQAQFYSLKNTTKGNIFITPSFPLTVPIHSYRHVSNVCQLFGADCQSQARLLFASFLEMDSFNCPRINEKLHSFCMEGNHSA